MTHLPPIGRGVRVRRWLSGALLAVSLLAPSRANAEAVRGPFDPLTVRVYDFGGVDGARLAKALQDARAIFGNAGIPSEWHDCTRGAKSSSAFCRQPRQGSDLIVRILRRHEGGDGLPAALGASVVESGRGVLATVFLDLVEPVARRNGADVNEVLGRAIAHEIGHLLLGTGTHSAAGLMREIWTDRELGRNDPRDWLFGTAEGALLRAARLRTTSQAPTQPGTFSTEFTPDTSAR